MIRNLQDSDVDIVKAFLECHVETSMFLLNNLERSGLTFDGEPYTGHYVGIWRDGELAGVCAHFWNGMMIAQCDEDDYDDLWRAAQTASGRKIAGVVGPRFQTEKMKAASSRKTKFDDKELLYLLALDVLEVPSVLEAEDLVCHLVDDDSFEHASRWRMEFDIESFGRERSDELLESSRRVVRRQTDDALLWMLRRGDEPVAMSAFNAVLEHTVQIGGVYTPPHLRGLGYGRAVVAATLLEARKKGVKRSILFTGEQNIAAQKAYTALGFRKIGTFGILMFDD